VVGALIGDRVGADRLQDLVAGEPVSGFGCLVTVPPPEADAAVVAAGLVGSAVGPHDHVDDRVEVAAREDLEGPVGGFLTLGGQLVCRRAGLGADHRATVRSSGTDCPAEAAAVAWFAVPAAELRVAGARVLCSIRPAALEDSVRTFSPKPSDVTKAWHVIDAEGLVLGRVATEVTALLRGKKKPIFAPHIDTGDHVIVINASKIDVSARKLADKEYFRHSGYPGGLRTESMEHLLARHPERVIRLAVRGMLPKNRIGRAQLKKLKIYAGPEHPHAAQQPQLYPLTSRRPA
jgi:large subunit ribosomal protein L13